MAIKFTLTDILTTIKAIALEITAHEQAGNTVSSITQPNTQGVPPVANSAVSVIDEIMGVIEPVLDVVAPEIGVAVTAIHQVTDTVVSSLGNNNASDNTQANNADTKDKAE